MPYVAFAPAIRTYGAFATEWGAMGIYGHKWGNLDNCDICRKSDMSDMGRMGGRGDLGHMPGMPHMGFCHSDISAYVRYVGQCPNYKRTYGAYGCPGMSGFVLRCLDPP